MVKINHSINLVTTLDETHPTSKQILALPNPEKFLAEIFESFLLEADIFRKLNEGNTFAKVELN
jgi:hypothetical protein